MHECTVTATLRVQKQGHTEKLDEIQLTPTLRTTPLMWCPVNSQCITFNRGEQQLKVDLYFSREHMDLETGTIREVGFLQTSTTFVASSITHQKTVLVCSQNSAANVCSAFDVKGAMCLQQQENNTFMTSKNVSQ